MSYAASIQSTTHSIATYARKMAQNGKPNMEILLDNHAEGKIYTTFDAVSGNVNITAPHNTRFDAIRITLEGTTKVYVENTNPHTPKARTTATHNFLKLVMPIRETDYPQPRIAEAGRTYTFPFNFVIPEQLLPRACTHGCNSEYVHQAHLQLPPSLGERDVSVLDDLAPEMSKIQYAIQIKVIRNRERDEMEVILVEGKKKLYVIPAVAEAPPVSTGSAYDDYVLSKTKSLRKGMFSGKLGKITVSAAQPAALFLPSPSSADSTPATTMATLNLRFDPHGASSEPPRLGGLNTKMKISTFFSTKPTREIPSHMYMAQQWETTRSVYDTSLNLSSRCVESVAWKKHDPQLAIERRNSDSSTCSSDCSESAAPETRSGATYYSATIIVPITLPTTKTWVPTFHTCITSRLYLIDLSLSIPASGKGVTSTSVSLHLPVQIAAIGNSRVRAPMTVAEAATELAEADEFLRPRVIEVPHQQHIGSSVLAVRVPSELPPSYEDFVPQPMAIVEPGRS